MMRGESMPRTHSLICSSLSKASLTNAKPPKAVIDCFYAVNLCTPILYRTVCINFVCSSLFFFRYCAETFPLKHGVILESALTVAKVENPREKKARCAVVLYTVQCKERS